MRKCLAALTILGALATCGACSSPRTATKAEYLATANQVCANAKQGLSGLQAAWVEGHPEDQGPDGTQRFVRFSLVKYARATMHTLRSIPPPPNDGAYLSSMYGDYEHALSILYSDPLGNSSAEAGTAAENRFESYGLKKCAGLLDGAGGDVEARLDAAYKKAKPSGSSTSSVSP